MSRVKVNGLLYRKGLAWTGLLRLFHYPSCGGAQQSARLFIAYVLTREPSEEIRFIHDRMPVILPGEAVEKWIRPDSKPDEIIKEAMTDMVFEKIIA